MPPTAKGKAHRRVERFDCRQFCRDGADDATRARYGCRRIDLEPIEAHVDVQRFRTGGWMGRSPLPRGAKAIQGVTTNPERPFEEPSEGCPSSWTRSRFVESVRPFIRTRLEHGARVPNPFFDRCEDDVLLQLAMYAEHEQDAFEAWAWEQVTSG